MKLFYCTNCQDVTRMVMGWRKCECGQSAGRYVDDLKAEISGKAVPLGFDNFRLLQALRARDTLSRVVDFRAFVIEPNCATITEVGWALVDQPCN